MTSDGGTRSNAELSAAGTAVRVSGLAKRYGPAVAVEDVTFTAEAGMLTTLLGPSGCGKTTTLRAIGGFITVDSGTITIGDRAIDGLPPYRRPTRTVFQSYALFPHMTVYENVAFGLKATRVRRDQVPTRVADALAMVGLEQFARRQSGQLSGGQQQRVAFARALVTRPEVLLLDEPLSNLDAKLRVQMRLEIRRLQRDVGITTIYVTHDQEEAMSLSDHVIVMDRGRIAQQGRPYEIYERPASRFVADFIGTSNLISVVVRSARSDGVSVEAFGTEVDLPAAAARAALKTGDTALMVVRPEHVRVTDEASGSEPGGLITACDYRGSAADYIVQTDSGPELTVEVSAPTGSELVPIGRRVALSIDYARVCLVRS